MWYLTRDEDKGDKSIIDEVLKMFSSPPGTFGELFMRSMYK